MRRVFVPLVLLVTFLVAAELNFSADADRTSVGLGEQFQLTVTVEGTNIGGRPGRRFRRWMILTYSAAPRPSRRTSHSSMAG
jgi:hypothetical protein